MCHTLPLVLIQEFFNVLRVLRPSDTHLQIEGTEDLICLILSVFLLNLTA